MTTNRKQRWTILIAVGRDASGKQLSAPYKTTAEHVFKRRVAGKTYEFGVTTNPRGDVSLTERRTGMAVGRIQTRVWDAAKASLADRAALVLDGKIQAHGEAKVRAVIDATPSWREACR